MALLQAQMSTPAVQDADQWIIQRRGFTNCLDSYDKVAFSIASVKYLQSRLQNMEALQQRVKEPQIWAQRHCDEMNAFREMQKVDRSRSAGLMKKVDDRLALARTQFKKQSFRVSLYLYLKLLRKLG